MQYQDDISILSEHKAEESEFAMRNQKRPEKLASDCYPVDTGHGINLYIYMIFIFEYVEKFKYIWLNSDDIFSKKFNNDVIFFISVLYCSVNNDWKLINWEQIDLLSSPGKGVELIFFISGLWVIF